MSNIINLDGKANMGGVSTPTILDCPRCGKKVIIPAGLILRIPANPDGDFCHVTADGKTGKEYKRG